jgi:hypothetical protein
MYIFFISLCNEVAYWTNIVHYLSSHFDVYVALLMVLYLVSWFHFLIPFVAALSLKMLGWHPFHPNSLNILSQSARTLLITQSLSPFEILIWLLYRISLQNHSKVKQMYLCFMIEQSYFQKYWYFNWLFTLLHVVPNSQHIVEWLPLSVQNKKQELIILTGFSSITPNYRWFEIAERLECDIGTIGINYHPYIKTIHCGTNKMIEACMINEFTAFDFVNQGLSSIFNDHLMRLQPKQHSKLLTPPRNLFFRSIVFFKDKSLSYQQNLESVHFSTVDLLCVTSCLFSIPAFAALQNNDHVFGCLTLLVGCSGWFYHYQYEQKSCLIIRMLCLVCWYMCFVFHIFYSSKINVFIQALVFVFLVCSLHCLYFVKRQSKCYRTMSYVLSCSLSYVLSCIAMLIFCEFISE